MQDDLDALVAIEHDFTGIAADADYPRTYVATWTVTGFQQFPGPFDTVCRSCLPVTNASFRLQALNARFGRFSLALTTFDRLANYPGMNEVQLAGEVALAPGNAIRINQAGGNAYAVFYGATFAGTPMMEASFSAPWAARTGGRLCFSGTNSFRRNFRITQVAFSGEDEAYSFDAGE